MKNSLKLIAGSMLLSIVAGGVMLITANVSLAGLKDDSCWDPKQVTIKDIIHSRSCLAYGRVEPNNGDKAGAAPSGSFSVGTSEGTTPEGGGDCVGAACNPPPDCVGAACNPPPDCVGEACNPPPDCVGEACTPPPSCETQGNCPPPQPPPACKGKECHNNKGFGNGEEYDCKGKDCFSGPGEQQNPSGHRPGRK